eukprot:CAMPEP_0176478888 /NCGR_PEP_ID=MMETSP0200_2-20121128/1429_1 /TAXON_ID=947934 /ORGANISM="Chaetoceros sp., Strain GSL56" /LENGTH=183 /DNA_ID=CAMNT_0017874861 /DNA_START=18 /DNA_END=566 /DNA_ORIENTATION=+
MKHTTFSILFFSSIKCIDGFSPQPYILHHKTRCGNVFQTVDDEAKEDEDSRLDPALASREMTSPLSTPRDPLPPKRLDPLVQSLTRNDVNTENSQTANLPLLGEVPLDGSIVVLAPVALIAIVGFVLTIKIGLESKDALVQQLDEINSVLSQPPVKQTVVDESGCRGLCSDQSEQLNYMRGFL